MDLVQARALLAVVVVDPAQMDYLARKHQGQLNLRASVDL